MASDLDARRGALRLLYNVLLEKQMLTEAANGLNLEGPDAARASRLAGLVLRHLGRIDAYLKPHITRRPPLRVQQVLRLAVAELRLDGGAPHGVVHAAVNLTNEVPKTARASGMVNAILRKLAEDTENWEALPPATLPPWLRAMVAKAHGQDKLNAIEGAHLAGAPLDLTLKGDRTEGLPGEIMPNGSLRIGSAQVTALPGFTSGDWWVQDAAASTPVRAMGDVNGLRVLDLCAAPGGKTMQLANAGAEVTALDISEGRLRRLQQNLIRTQLQADVIAADAMDWTPDAPFDAVLLDAPCSATGTIRRHPDLPHLRTKAEIEALTKLQYQLLDRALTFVKPGGSLMYCTCSLLPVEGEHQITAALKRHPGLVAETLEPEALGLPTQAAAPNGLRLTPDMWADRGGMDGFYIARLRVPA